MKFRGIIVTMRCVCFELPLVVIAGRALEGTIPLGKVIHKIPDVVVPIGVDDSAKPIELAMLIPAFDNCPISPHLLSLRNFTHKVQLGDQK
jgi:hypothetical protein